MRGITRNFSASWIGIPLLLLAATCAQGAVFTIDTGGLTATRFISGTGGEQLDVRGAVSLTGPQGTALVLDSTNGTDPNFTTLPFGNSTLLGLNLALSQDIALTFDLAHPAITPTTITLAALGAAVNPVPTTDAALIQLLGTSSFAFNLGHLSDLGNGNFLVTYNLVGVTAPAGVPEPASVGLVAVAGIALTSLRRRLTARP